MLLNFFFHNGFPHRKKGVFFSFFVFLFSFRWRNFPREEEQVKQKPQPMGSPPSKCVIFIFIFISQGQKCLPPKKRWTRNLSLMHYFTFFIQYITHRLYIYIYTIQFCDFFRDRRNCFPCITAVYDHPVSTDFFSFFLVELIFWQEAEGFICRNFGKCPQIFGKYQVFYSGPAPGLFREKKPNVSTKSMNFAHWLG